MLASVSDKTNHVRAVNAIYSARTLTEPLGAAIALPSSNPSDAISAEGSSFSRLFISHLSVSGAKERVRVGKQVVMVGRHN